ncbi:MAG: type II secretion system F family protein [Alphaproteobacteria bacterium]|nr:type II secretion system F family protein [Alphaproteobacteria bacterium]
MPDPILLIYAAIFIAAILLVEGIFYLVQDSVVGPRRVNRRMQMLNAGHGRREVHEMLRRRPDPGAGLPEPLRGMLRRLDQLVVESGARISTLTLLLVMSGLGFGAVFLATSLVAARQLPLAFASPPALLGIALLAGVGLPLGRILQMRRRRKKKFAEQLANALDLMVRSLQAGHPIPAALDMVSTEMPDPIGTEFGIVVDEMTYGMHLNEALENLTRRVGVDDLKFVEVAINIQHETGGNLAETLQGLANVIRDRFRMFKKIRVLSSEGRLSARILAVLPFVFAGFMLVGNPDFYLAVVRDPLFVPGVAIALALELFGILIMWKLVNFKV